MRVSRLCLPAFLCALALSTSNAYAADSLILSVSNGTTVSSGQPITITASVIDNSTNKVDTAYAGAAGLVLTSSDPSILLPKAAPSLSSGVAGPFSVTFYSVGTMSLTITNGALTSVLSVNVVSSLAGCSSCYASIGAGAVITSPGLSDYTVNNNILESTSLDHSRSTPQYLVGVAYKLPIPDLLGISKGRSLYKHLGCQASTDFNNPATEARAAYCYPYKVFINFKFTPDASETFNGFTYGLTLALHKELDFLLGASYSPYNNVSGGFQNAAIATVKDESGNRCYSQWTSASLSANGKGAFNGFPTQLLTDTTPSAATPTCSAGAQIYGGSIVTTSYHTGFFIGVSIPVSLAQFFK